MFGFDVEVLARALTFEQAQGAGILKEDATDDGWGEPFADDDAVRAAAVDYLQFAFGKAQDHRGLSASRSVDKMTEFLWLLNIDTTPVGEASFQNYGVPQLKVVAGLLDVPFPTDADLVRMADGLPCRPECDEGCSTR